MKTTPFKEIKLKLPGGVVETISEEEIFNMLIDAALSKAKHYLGRAEYYLRVSKCKETKERYGTHFISLRKRVEKVKKKVVAKSDDLVVCGLA